MYKFLQRNGKHLMAVFSVFLMIAFTLPSAYKRASGSAPVVAKIGEDKINSDEVYNSRKAWETLNTIPIKGGTLAMALGPNASAQITKHPVEFLLLQKEAQKMGIAVSNDQLLSELTNTPGLITTDEDRNAAVKQAVASLLLVRSAFERAAGVVKISEPIVKQDLALMGQSITVNSVEFPAAKYTAKVPPPTAEQLKSQFEKYADLLKGGVSQSNLFGFGYRFPNRVKFQYIVIPKSDVRKVVAASKDADPAKNTYAWRVEAQKFYMQNMDKFRAAPTTSPSADPLSLGTGGSKKTPTTKPFSEVEKLITDQIIDKETAQKMSAIAERITSTMAADWVTYSNLASATQPTSGPTSAPVVMTSLKAPYASFEYLQKIAAIVQNEFKVLPTVVSQSDKWLTSEEAAKLPGIGGVKLKGVAIADYLTQLVAPFVSPEHRSRSEVLKVLEPTTQMLDDNGSIYIARVTEADPSHKPATFVEVEQAVHDDVISSSAYELAKADANKLLDEARKTGINQAAGDKSVVPVGPLTVQAAQSVPVLTLTGASAMEFIRGAFALLTTPTSRPAGQPVALIDLPRDGRIFVSELGKVQATWTQRSLPFDVAQVHAMAADRLRNDFDRAWFDFDSLSSRMKYVPDTSFKDAESLPPPPQPTAPMF